MADTLLFRGGSSADIAASTVQNRELVIDTDTDQIVSGASKKRTVMEESNGNVKIGGGNISLNANGNGEFTGLTKYARPTDGAMSLQVGYDETVFSGIAERTQRCGLYNASGGGGDIQIGLVNQGPSKGSLNIYDVNSDSVVTQLKATGDVLIGGTLPSSPNISLKADGNATFAGDITCTDNSKGLILKSPNGTSFRLSVANDGTLSASSI